MNGEQLDKVNDNSHEMTGNGLAMPGKKRERASPFVVILDLHDYLHKRLLL